MLKAGQPDAAGAAVADVIPISQGRVALLLAVGTSLISFATLCARFGKAVARVAPLMQDRPAIADQLALLLSKRNASELLRLGRGDGADAATTTIAPLRARIRHLFNL